MAVAAFVAIGIFRMPMIPAMLALMIGAFSLHLIRRGE
jgi:hypothetical protein